MATLCQNGEDIGQSLLQNKFVLHFSYAAVFPNNHDSKVTGVEN